MAGSWILLVLHFSHKVLAASNVRGGLHNNLTSTIACLPVQVDPEKQMRIYRRFLYGKLVNLMMLDTRFIGRDQQYTNPYNTSGLRYYNVSCFNQPLPAYSYLSWLPQQNDSQMSSQAHGLYL
jgi:hypothetical protein